MPRNTHNKREVHPKTDQLATRLANQELQGGKSPSTAARHFVHEEMHHMKEGVHSAKNPKQAIAIGLSKARKHGVPLRSKMTKMKSKSGNRKKAA